MLIDDANKTDERCVHRCLLNSVVSGCCVSSESDKFKSPEMSP